MDFTKYLTATTIAASGSGTTQGTNTVTTNITKFTAATAGAAATLAANLAAGGLIVIANQDAANAMVVFPPTGGTINGGSANASVALAAAKTRIFFPVDGTGLNWFSVLTA